ncbi:MAG TPA: CDP-alcohol phosphatidyltransferase family protein [Polyangia bacterium]|nr:CDP-alcohol phosphatidyltransferase family protein [Polyangia bacterium]
MQDAADRGVTGAGVSGGEIPLGARRMFGLKDVFTSINALSGVLGVYFVIKGHPLWGSYSFLAGYAADCVDGLVARATRGGNRFGAEFDTAADFVAQAVAPAFVVYGLYAQSGQRLGVSAEVADAIGLLLAAVLVLVATVRQARNTVRPVSVDFAWVGLPRNVASFLLLSYVNSAIFSRLPGGLWLGIPFVFAIAWAELSNLPFMSHHGRKQIWHAKWLLIAFLTTTPLSLLVCPRYTWDIVFFWTGGYTLGSWSVMSARERQFVREAVAAADAKLVAEETARFHAHEAARVRARAAAAVAPSETAS